jgi:hypothetical protein
MQSIFIILKAGSLTSLLPNPVSIFNFIRNKAFILGEHNFAEPITSLTSRDNCLRKGPIINRQGWTIAFSALLRH